MANYLPTRKPRQEGPLPGGQKPRWVRTTQFFWLNMDVPFTSLASEQRQAFTVIEQFPLSIMGAWSDLTGPRVRLVGSNTEIPLSTLQVPLLTYAGNSDLVYPMLYWRRPYPLPPNTGLRGEFLNDAGEAAGNVIFFCERPDFDQPVQVKETRQYQLLLDLGLSGGATGTGNATTQQIQEDLLIYGALSTSVDATVRFFDTQKNIAWSEKQLPIGAFAGIRASGNVQPIMYYPAPYFLPRNASIRVEWTNAGNESGKFITFLCERILQ